MSKTHVPNHNMLYASARRFAEDSRTGLYPELPEIYEVQVTGFVVEAEDLEGKEPALNFSNVTVSMKVPYSVSPLETCLETQEKE